MKAPGPIMNRDMYFVSANGLFVRSTIDRANFEFGVMLGGEWKVAATAKNRMIPATNTWYTLVCSYDGTALRLYVDGVLQAEVPCSGKVTFDTLAIGTVGWSNDVSGEFQGMLDAIKYATMKKD
jgi:hypothetical protein